MFERRIQHINTAAYLIFESKYRILINLYLNFEAAVALYTTLYY